MECIYRVENKDGQGPYNFRFTKTPSFIKRHRNSPKRPSPMFDPKISEFVLKTSDKELSEMIFGFNSIEQLKSWFTNKNLIELEEHGFYVNRIEISQVSKIVISERQVMFKRK